MTNLPEEFGVHITFNVSDLHPFVGGSNDEAESADLRINPLQEGGDDKRALNKGPTTRVISKRIQEECNSVEPRKVKFLST